MHLVTHETLSEIERRALAAATEVAERAWVPYSGFRVGAALVTEGDEIYRGANVENASYGLTICAERAAAVAAISDESRVFLLLALWTPTPEPPVPCGACRQFLCEFAPGLRCVLGCEGPEVAITSLDELMPSPFRFGSTPSDG